ncbi:MAG: protein adenylyltransferase SelO family protein, partial [Marinobacter sp.]
MSSNDFRVEHRYLELPDSFYTRVQPTPLKDAKMACFNHKLAQDMGFHTTNEADWAKIGGGTELLEGMDPVAMKYTGHQFGGYNPDLGDG